MSRMDRLEMTRHRRVALQHLPTVRKVFENATFDPDREVMDCPALLWREAEKVINIKKSDATELAAATLLAKVSLLEMKRNDDPDVPRMNEDVREAAATLAAFFLNHKDCAI